MQRIASQIIRWVNLPFLSLLPCFALAGNSAPEDYVPNESLMLEVRYCECQAAKSDSLPSDLLPGFLADSGLLKVSVSSDGKGFLSSGDLSVGYELRPVAGSPEQFQLNYAGSYTTSDGKRAANGQLMLVQEQWVILFGSRHDKDTESRYSNVAVRLVKSAGS